MEICQFDQRHMEDAQALLREAFQRADSDPVYNEWTFARRLLDDGGYIPALCLAAVEDGRAIGYNALTTARAGREAGLALGPLAVAEACRNQGVGSALVEEGLRRAREAGYPWVAVLGGDYYRRFGFEPAGAYGLTVSDNAFDNEHLQVIFLQNKPKMLSARLAYCGAFYDGDGNLL